MSAADCPSAQLLQAFQLGNLPEPSLDEIADHLESCARCETLAQQLDSECDPIVAAIRRPAGTGFQLTRMLQRPAPPPDAGPLAFPFLLPAARPDELGRLGNYRVLRLLGKGGMAFVFLAEDVALMRPVALKVMKPDLGRDDFGWQRFLREARIMAAIKHENLVTVYQAGQEGDTVWLAMELLEGESLSQRLERSGPIEIPEALRLAKELTNGLAGVHGHGLLHRDLKPANIWLEAPGNRIKILDFGLARFMNDKSNLTLPGTVLGTPAFMSPEQARGEATDARSDLFSLGCVLYAVCTGVKPFGAENTMSVLNALAVHSPRPLYEINPGIPKPLSDLVAQLLAKSPDERPATAQAVLERLRQLEAQLTDAPTNSPAPTANGGSAATGVKQQSVRRRISSRWPWLGLTVLLLGLLCYGAWTLIPGGADRLPSSSPSGDGAIFLSDLQEFDPVNWPFFGKLPAAPPDESSDWPAPKGGRRVRIQDKASPHGIFMHLPRQPADKKVRISYRLDRLYRTFNTEVSLNDGPADCTPLTFTVYGDGKVLWQSKPVTSQAHTQRCAGLAVDGIDQLTLELGGTGEERGTQGVWVEPYLTK
jgi:serine/threonine protein kinase